ncbi:MAG: hypothetical protein ACRDDW_02900 [Candidatus Rhabdochlamydia sp.]
MTINNFLNIPPIIYGLPGIKTGNLIYQTLEKRGLRTEYNLGTCITVLDSSDLPISVLDILKEQTFDANCYPMIKEERDIKGNLQIELPLTYEIRDEENEPEIGILKFLYKLWISG